MGGESVRWLGLINLPHSCANCLEIWEPQHSGTHRACLDLNRDRLTSNSSKDSWNFFSLGLYYYYYYYYYYYSVTYLLELNFHSVAVVLTLVQIKQIIHMKEIIKNTIQTKQNTVNTSTHINKTPTHNKTNTHTPTLYKIHTYTHPYFTKSTHLHTHT